MLVYPLSIAEEQRQFRRLFLRMVQRQYNISLQQHASNDRQPRSDVRYLAAAKLQHRTLVRPPAVVTCIIIILSH